MGLDTSHDCWHGAYGSFARWRNELARVAGYALDERGDYMLPWDMLRPENYQGEWDSPPGDDPLLYLLAHSDCDGVIHPEQGVHIASRLEQLLPLIDEDKSAGHLAPSIRGKTQQFIDGLRAAAANDEDVDFH